MELEILKWIQSFSNPGLDLFFQWITAMGEEAFYILFFTLFYWCYDKRGGIYISFIFFFSTLVNAGLKETFQTSRPIGIEGLRSLRLHTAPGYSFPSGHTQGAATFWTGLMAYYKKAWVTLLGSVMIFLIALSRLYLGVHWPKDVIAGIFFAILCVYIGYRLMAFYERKNSIIPIATLVLLAMITPFYFKTATYIKLASVFVGLSAGILIERHFINFSPKASLHHQVFKVLLGFLGILVITKLLKPLLPHHSLSDALRYFLLGLWVLAGAPYCFKVFGWRYPPLTKVSFSDASH